MNDDDDDAGDTAIDDDRYDENINERSADGSDRQYEEDENESDEDDGQMDHDMDEADDRNYDRYRYK